MNLLNGGGIVFYSVREEQVLERVNEFLTLNEKLNKPEEGAL